MEIVREDKFRNNIAIAESDPMELLQYMQTRYLVRVPEGIRTGDDLGQAGVLLGRLTNDRTYLMSLLSYLKYLTKLERSGGKDNAVAYQEMMSRRDIVQDAFDTVDKQYEGLSRMVTVYVQELRELEMTSGRRVA
jgi:hypothetical protein